MPMSLKALNCVAPENDKMEDAGPQGVLGIPSEDPSGE